MPAILIKVHGEVQGVFFRATARKKAEELNVTGWTRNMDDGSVEILACGGPHDLDAIVEWCKSGPPSAHVSSVETEPATDEHYNDFSIIR